MDLKGGFILIYILSFLILTIAAIEDIRCSKVSNNLIFLGYSISVLYQFIYQKNIMFWLQGFFVPILVLFVFFYLRMFGAGDIKLLSVLGVFCGWKFSLMVFIIALMYGAVWSILKLLYHHNLKVRISYFITYLDNLISFKKRIPYLDKTSIHNSYTIPFSVMILLAFISYTLLGV